MVIGIFTDTFFPEINGVATSIQVLKRELERAGHTVYVITCSNPKVRWGGDIQGTMRLPSVPFVLVPGRRVAAFYKKSVAHTIGALGLDIAHTNTEFSLGMFGKLVARSMGIPVVHTFHTMYEDYLHYITKGHFTKYSKEFARFYCRTFCNGCDQIIAPTDKTRDLLLEYEVERPIAVVPTGVDISMFDGSRAQGGAARAAAPPWAKAMRASLGISPGDQVILYVGRLAREKNIDCVVRNLPPYLARHPATKFLMVGDGPWQKEILDEARALGIAGSLVFAGEQPWRDIPRYYAIGDVFVSASQSETQGLTFIEAMAAGLPVLAKKDRSIEKLVVDGVTGSVFEDDRDIPAKLERLLGDGALRARLARNARRAAEGNSVESFARNVEAVYRRTLRQWKRGGPAHRSLLNRRVVKRIIL
jgi:1,2-diacylglycerol 3-alpha-glucosyltransferase